MDLRNKARQRLPENSGKTFKQSPQYRINIELTQPDNIAPFAVYPA